MTVLLNKTPCFPESGLWCAACRGGDCSDEKREEWRDLNDSNDDFYDDDDEEEEYGEEEEGGEEMDEEEEEDFRPDDVTSDGGWGFCAKTCFKERSESPGEGLEEVTVTVLGCKEGHFIS